MRPLVTPFLLQAIMGFHQVLPSLLQSSYNKQSCHTEDNEHLEPDGSFCGTVFQQSNLVKSDLIP